MHRLKVTSLLLLAFSLTVVLTAEAAELFAPPVCPAMMKAASMGTAHSCCGSDCDCAVREKKTETSMEVPVTRPDVRPSFDSFAARSADLDIPSFKTAAAPSGESPPQTDPLYQEYSDYRL